VQQDGRRDGWAADVFMAPVSEPDAEGRVHLGWGPWHTKGLLRAAKLRVAEVSRGVLPVRGDTTVPLADFDLVVESRDEPFDLPPAYPEPAGERREVTDAVGAAVATLVRDGDTIQIGTGTLSACMGSYLTGKRDLGIDSEILVPSVIELVRRGVATGRQKTYHPGVATGALITPGCDQETCSDNPAVALYDVEWVNSLPRIATIRNLVAINQALAIDLTGQVAAESFGPVMFSGPGGQLMWTMGALFAPGGRAVQVLPSTARGGTVSRIVSQLDPGTIVTVPRTFVDFVVTEHGITNLQGRTQRERALALIELAHPSFRAALHAEARARFWPA
jgi:4-hydroxybutyrate CoA-transferase